MVARARVPSRRILLTHGPKRAAPGSAHDVGLAWLVKLRWAAFVGQVVLAAGATLTLGHEARNVLVALLVAATGASNLALHLWVRRRPEGAPPASGLVLFVLVADVVVLTGILLGSGGPANPFSIFYLVHVALAALLLGKRAMWIVAGLTTLGFGSLFLLLSPDLVMRQMHAHGVDFHLRGMWLSYTIATVFVGYFVAELARALFQRERDLAELSRYAAKTEKLAALASLAGGAAHELATPVGTIALVAGELARAGEVPRDRLVEDAELLQREAERCRRILDRMRAPDRGKGTATTREIAALLAGTFPDIEDRGPDARVAAPAEAVVQVLSVLVQNARDAGARRVDVAHRVSGGEVGYSVEDDGPGLPADLAERVGEPFVSAKAPGEGGGLGLFLAARLAEELGGVLELESSEKGTTALFVLPGEAA